MFTAQQNLSRSHPLTVFLQSKLVSPPSCFNQMLHTMLVEFLAKFFDLILERCICIDVEICFPYVFEEFFFCHDFPDVLYEKLKNIELLWGQVEILPVQKGFSGPQIEFQTESSDLDQGGLFGIGTQVATHQCRGMGQKQFLIQRPFHGEAGIRSGVQCPDLLLPGIVGRQDKNGGLL